MSLLQQAITFTRLDLLIGEYYTEFEKDNYFSTDGIGRFMRYIIEEEFIDPDLPIDDQIGTTSSELDCGYVAFDFDNFPIANNTIIFGENDKSKVIFFILQYCYQHQKLPTKESRSFYFRSIFHIADTVLCCSDNIISCDHFKRLLSVMKKYNQFNKPNYTNILRIVNCYIHLIIEHDSDSDFEYIVASIGCCNISQCKMFMRNYLRRRVNVTKYIDKQTLNNLETNDIAYLKIMDKIHCHFMHC
eukprot:59228_1